MIVLSKYESQVGDGSEVGFFFRAPNVINFKRGSLGVDDESPAHITFLYIGKMEENNFDGIVEISEPILKSINSPFTVSLSGNVSVFKNDDKWVAHQVADFPDQVHSARRLLKEKLIESGINVDDKYEEWIPHLTLMYMPVGHEYTGETIDDEWICFGVEIWGLPNLKYLSFNKRPNLIGGDTNSDYFHLNKDRFKKEYDDENEEIERLIKPEPKIYPKRRDMERKRIIIDDPDLTQGSDKNNRGGKDMSLNYKRV